MNKITQEEEEKKKYKNGNKVIFLLLFLPPFFFSIHSREHSNTNSFEFWAKSYYGNDFLRGSGVVDNSEFDRVEDIKIVAGV